jgi:hypothetical protein
LDFLAAEDAVACPITGTTGAGCYTPSLWQSSLVAVNSKACCIQAKLDKNLPLPEPSWPAVLDVLLNIASLTFFFETGQTAYALRWPIVLSEGKSLQTPNRTLLKAIPVLAVK